MAHRGSTAAPAPAFVEEAVLHSCQVTGYAPKTKTYDITVHPTRNNGQPYIIQHTLEQFASLEASVRSVVKVQAPFPQKKTWSNPSVQDHKRRIQMLTNWLNELVQRSEHLFPLQAKLFAFLDVHDMIVANKPVHAQAELLGAETTQSSSGGGSGGGGSGGVGQSGGGPAVLDFGALAAGQMDYTAAVDEGGQTPSPAAKKAPAAKSGMSRAAIANARRASMAPATQAPPQPRAGNRRASAAPLSATPPVLLQATPLDSPGHAGRKLVAHALNDGSAQQPTAQAVARELGVDLNTARAMIKQDQQAANQLPPPAPSKAERLARELNIDVATAQRIIREEADAQQKQGELRRLQDIQRQHDLEQEQLRQEELQQGGQVHAALRLNAAHQERQAQLAQEEARQGGPVQTELIDSAVEKTLTVTIPQGVGPGQKLKVKFEGTNVVITVPQGAQAGSKLKVRVKAPHRRPSAAPAPPPGPKPTPAPATAPAPAPAPMPVLAATPVQEPVQTLIQVPPGCKGGDKVHLDLADGRKIEIVLPPGVTPGMQVAVMVPP